MKNEKEVEETSSEKEGREKEEDLAKGETTENAESNKDINKTKEKESPKGKESKKDDEVRSNVKESKTQWFIICLIAFVIVLFLVSWSITESKKFEYIGLTFTKEKFNDFDIYTVPLIGINVNGGQINFKINLRNDPRENDVPIERNVQILENRPVYIALNMSTPLEKCGSVPLVALGQFFAGMGHEVITGVTEATRAEELDRLHTNCDNNLRSTVLLLTEANKTEIVVNEGNSDCYEVRVNNCEVEEALEKVELSILSTLTHVPL